MAAKKRKRSSSKKVTITVDAATLRKFLAALESVGKLAVSTVRRATAAKPRRAKKKRKGTRKRR